MQVIITKDLNDKLKAMLCFASKKDIRYYLNGVCLDVSGGVLRAVATDGHVLGLTIIGPVPGEPDAQYILPGEFVERIVKTRDAYELTVSPDGATASHGFSCKLIDGRYPDWRRVVVFPAGDPEMASYDADILARIAKASKALGNKHGYFAMRQCGTSGAPFKIADDFIGVIMPLRYKDAGTVSPNEFNAVRGA